jgi:hypothetical protein
MGYGIAVMVNTSTEVVSPPVHAVILGAVKAAFATEGKA